MDFITFSMLNVFCDDSHPHQPWGPDEHDHFNTAKEAQYPVGLTEAYSDVLAQWGVAKGWDPPSTAEKAVLAARPYTQLRGRKMPQLILKYLEVVSVQMSDLPTVDSKQRITHSVQQVPKNSKLLRTEAKRGGWLCVFGIFRTMEQFVQASRAFEHPFDSLLPVPDRLLTCLFEAMTMSPRELTKERLHTLKELRVLRERFACEEATLHTKVPTHI